MRSVGEIQNLRSNPTGRGRGVGPEAEEAGVRAGVEAGAEGDPQEAQGRQGRDEDTTKTSPAINGIGAEVEAKAEAGLGTLESTHEIASTLIVGMDEMTGGDMRRCEGDRGQGRPCQGLTALEHDLDREPDDPGIIGDEWDRRR